MKIGIMTMQRIKNYGSFLQAYGLKKNFEELGCDVEFVDYHYEKSLVENKENIIRKVLRNINVGSYLRKKQVQKKYDEAFDEKFIPELCGPNLNYAPKNIDTLVIGSDEVFNCLQGYPVGYSRELFGKGFDYCPIFSYAASFGQTNYKRLVKYGIATEVGELLSKFKKISVRDKNSLETVAILIGKQPSLHLDPVLVTDFSAESVDNVRIKDYIIVYAYPGRLTKGEEKTIKKFAKRHNKKIVSFGMYQRIADVDEVVHPFEIFSYFKHADFVITDTFHGSIFSIKMHTNFCTIVRDDAGGNSNKLQDLLSRLKQSDRIISSMDQLEDFYTKSAEFKETDKVISVEMERSRNYFKAIVDGEDNE